MWKFSSIKEIMRNRYDLFCSSCCHRRIPAQSQMRAATWMSNPSPMNNWSLPRFLLDQFPKTLKTKLVIKKNRDVRFIYFSALLIYMYCFALFELQFEYRFLNSLALAMIGRHQKNYLRFVWLLVSWKSVSASVCVIKCLSNLGVVFWNQSLKRTSVGKNGCG